MNKATRILGCVITAVLVLAGSALAGTVWFCHTDPAGSPLAMTDASVSLWALTVPPAPH